jgi:hypothetical protein
LRPGVAAHEGSAGNCKKDDRLGMKWTHEVQLYLFFNHKKTIIELKNGYNWPGDFFADQTPRIPYKPKLGDWPGTDVSKPQKLNRRK